MSRKSRWGAGRDRPGESRDECASVAMRESAPLVGTKGRGRPTAGASIAAVLAAPGGYGTRRELHNPAMLAHLRAANAAQKMMLSVCTGSLLFARAGLLTGLAATTHAGAMDELRALGTDFQVR